MLYEKYYLPKLLKDEILTQYRFQMKGKYRALVLKL